MHCGSFSLGSDRFSYFFKVTQFKDGTARAGMQQGSRGVV
jgi:hypothetical protein